MDKVALKQDWVVIDTETTGTNPHTCKLLGISTYEDGKLDYLPYLNVNALLNKKLIGHNIKYDLIVLKRYGYDIPKAYFDTMLAYYLLHIDKSKKLENILSNDFNVQKDDLVAIYNKSTGENRVNLPEDWYDKIDHKLLAEYAKEDAHATGWIYKELNAQLKEQPILNNWFHEVEMPILNILVEMEMKGVKVDRKQLQNLADNIKPEIDGLEKRIKYFSQNKDFNLNSSKQLRELLFNKLELPIEARTEKGEASTDKDTIQQLAKKYGHYCLDLLLKYREYSKAYSTYTYSLIDKLDENDRLHTSFNQCLTNTRRFSSQDPNLQNIPTRSDLGKKIKGCFIPEKGHKFLIADYSQLEPRILAHLSKDKFLIECFKNGDDIYEHTANIVRASGRKEFSRDRSKILFLALMYGKSSFGLAQDWHCSETEAEEIVQAVFQKLSGVSAYIQEIQEIAFKTGGWLTSLAGLPLYVGDPHSNNKWESKAVDRCAINYPIQASSQDILKKAVVNIYNKENRFPVLMVHDELVFEIGSEHTQRLVDTLIYEMEHAWELDVPLKVEYKLTDKWEK